MSKLGRKTTCAGAALALFVVMGTTATFASTASAAVRQLPSSASVALMPAHTHRSHPHYRTLREHRTHTPKVTASLRARLLREGAQSNVVNGPAAVQLVSGTITGHAYWGPGIASTYVISGSVTVASGASLVIAPGTVVKSYGAGTPCEGGLDANLCVRGILYAIGAPGQPIAFTSINDASVGAPVGEGVVEPGDWSGIGLEPGSASFVQDASIDYAQVGIQGAGTWLPFWTGIIGDSFANEVGAAVILANTPEPVVANNTATNAGVDSFTYFVSSQHLDFSHLFGNTSTGSGANDFAVSGTADSSRMTAQPIPWFLDGTLSVPGGQWLSIAPGAVVKAYGPGATCEGGLDANLCVRGTLYALGTASQPITFTSINDGTVGGSTGIGVVEPGDWSGIGLQPGSASFVEDAAVDYAQVGIEGSGAQLPYWTTISGDAFANEVGAALILANAASPYVENNSATNAGVDDFAYFASSTRLDLGRLYGNLASGAGSNEFGLAGSVVTSKMSDQAIPWFVDPSLTVPAGATLSVAPGTIVKSYGVGTTCESGITANVCVDGALVAIGTATQPITFTSINDSSVGGTTGIEPASPGDWAGIDAAQGASLNVQDDSIDFAATGVGATSAGTGSDVVDGNTFDNDETGAAVRAGTGSSAQVENNAFSNDEVALDATSTWSTLSADPASCGYVPYVEATGNTFLSSSDTMSTTPLVTPADYGIITGGTLPTVYGVPTVQDFPPAWAAGVQPSTMDTVVVSYQACFDTANPSASYVAVSTPLDLGGVL